MMQEVGADAAELDAIYRLTSLPTEKERYVIPPSHREEAEQMLKTDVLRAKGETGFGFLERPVRGT